jgi:hypothetical protein
MRMRRQHRDGYAAIEDYAAIRDGLTVVRSACRKIDRIVPRAISAWFETTRRAAQVA